MIEKLDSATLIKYKFDQDAVERLTTWDNYEMFLVGNNGIFWASNTEQLIYSGKEGERKYYFRNDSLNFPQSNLDLIPEYYSLKENIYLEQQRKIAASLFVKKLARKDFLELELEWANKLIADLKADKMYDRLNSKKEYVNKLNWYLKWLNNFEIKEENESSASEKINWINVFEELDIDTLTEIKVHKINTLSQKQNYFSEGSYNLTVQYILNFKRNTHLLSPERKLQYIKTMQVQAPTMSKTDSTLFNQTVFEGQSNFYEFILNYSRSLEQTLKPEYAALNQANKIELLHVRLSGLAYFAPMEGDGIKIQMFYGCSNDEFRKIVREELDEIRNAEAEGNKKVPDPYRSRDIMMLEKNYEVSLNDLIHLFNDKFSEAKALGFKTAQRYAAHEIKELDLHYKKAAQYFPLFDQWREFLNKISTTGIIPSPDIRDRTYSSHTYDLDLVSAFQKLQKVLETQELKPGSLSKKEYLSRVLEGFYYFCKFNNYEYHFHFKQNIPLIVASEIHSYPYYLGFALISIEIHLINAFIDHQHKNYKGPDDFLNVVEFGATSCVQSNSPFDNSVRLEKIMQWVEKKRESQSSMTTTQVAQSSITLPSQYQTLLGLKSALSINDTNTFFKTFQSIFSTMSYNMKVTEGYFHSHIHFSLKLLDFNIFSEVETSDGRIDSVIESDHYIHIVEYKLNDSTIAIDQIKRKKYYLPYLTSPKEIILVGVALDANSRNILDWQSQKYEK